MFYDCHCHLDFEQFDADRDQVMERAKDVLVVNSIVEPEKVGFGIELAKRYDNLYLSIGLSPSELDGEKFNDVKRMVVENRNEIVAIGEVGLDYYWIKEEMLHEIQKERFSQFIKLSKRLGLPLVVHSRDSEGDCIMMLKDHGVSALMHCFSGSLNEANDAVDAGCLISVPANVTYVKSRQKLVRHIGLEDLVLETDAPYLGPERGVRNEPANVKRSAEKIGEILGVSAEKVREKTFENSKRFYRL